MGKEEKLYVKMVETSYGFQVANLTFSAKDNKIEVEALSESIASDIEKLSVKFEINPSKTLLVSVFRVGNATLSSDNEWIEDDGPILLESELSVYNNLLILERRHLGELMAEKSLTNGPFANFLTSTFLIDAEIRLKDKKKMDESGKVVLDIRIKYVDGKLVKNLTQEGTLKQFPSLMRKGADDLVKNLLELKKINVVSSASAESKLWLKLAEKNWEIEKWERPEKSLKSAEAAYALSPENRKARIQMVKSLTMKAIRDCRGRLSEESSLNRAKLLEKALVYCLPPENKKERQAFLYIAAGGNSGFLSNKSSVIYNSVRQILRPVRRMVLKASLENMKPRTKKDCDIPELEDSFSACYIFRMSYCMFETPYEAALFLEPAINKISNSEKLSRKKKSELLNIVFSNCGPFWGLHFSDFPWDKEQSRKIWIPIFKKMTNNPDKLVQMHAYKMLTMAAYKHSLKIESSKKFMDLYYEYLCQKRKKGDPFYNISCSDLIRGLPEKEQAEYYKKIYFSSVERKDIDCFLKLRSHVHIRHLWELIPDKDSNEMVDKSLKFLKEYEPDSDKRIDAESMFLVYKSNLIYRNPEFNESEPKFDIKVLWDRHRDLSKEIKIRRPGLLVPQRMLVEGEILWVSFGTTNWGATKRDVALAKINLKTGKTIFFRGGSSISPDEDKWRGDYYGESSQICRFKDWICVGQADVGVYLFPENCVKTDNSIKTFAC